MKIDNRVINCELIEFSKLQWFQGDLKIMKEDAAMTLKNAIEDAYIDPFALWKKKENDIKILNGHQRYAVMKNNGFDGMVPYFFVRCKNEKEAAKFVLYFDSKPGRVTDEGLYKFMHDFELGVEDFKDSVSFVELDLNEFEIGYIDDGNLDIIDNELENSNIDHFYQGNSRMFRFGDLMCYVTDEKLIEKMNEMTGKIINHNEDQRYLNSVGKTIVGFILENENKFLPKE